MLEFFGFVQFLLWQGAGLVIAIVVGLVFVFGILKKLHSTRTALLLFIVLGGVFVFLYVPQGLPRALEVPFALHGFGPGAGPVLPLSNVFAFFRNLSEFERVPDIARNPNSVPPPLTRREPATVLIHTTTKEVIAEIAPGIVHNYWTFDGTVPGPFHRVRVGDTIELTIENDASSLHHHNIDFHAVTGPGGGASVTNVAPGETKIARFKALNPGLYVYHCAHENVPSHMAHGMYGLILVEPEEGLPEVDHEYYIMQGELYTTGALGKRGLQMFDGRAMLDGKAQYVVFNGRVRSLVDTMEVEAGDRVRLYVGNGGVNYISSFHVIGEIFDRVYPEASIGGPVLENVQTTAIPAGGATIVEFTADVPGTYVLVDHALARVDRGAWGTLEVSGALNPDVYDGEVDAEAHGH